MAQQKYLKANQSLGKAEINLETDDIRVILIDSANYTVDYAAHQFLSDIPALARVATSTSLLNKIVGIDGVLDADDIVLTAVSGNAADAVVLYIETGTETTSRLISYDNTSTDLPVTPDGTDITVIFDNVNKIFKI